MEHCIKIFISQHFIVDNAFEKAKQKTKNSRQQLEFEITHACKNNGLHQNYKDEELSLNFS